MGYLGGWRALQVMYPALFNAPLMLGAHALLGAILVYRTLKLDQAKYSLPAIQNFYVWVWNLFYSEYFLLPWLSATGLHTVVMPALGL
jgi:homogentisate solanesyltransferase